MVARVSANQAVSLSVHTLGAVVPLRIKGEALAHAVTEAWRDCLIDPANTPDTAAQTAPLTVGIGEWGEADVRGEDAAEVLHNLAKAVTEAAVAARAGDLVMLKSAALANPQTGEVLLLISAGPGTGLTTAATVLGEDLVLLSDAITAVSTDAMVLPARTPIARPGAGNIRTQTPPSALAGPQPQPRDYRVRAVWILARDSAHSAAPEIEELHIIDALAALAAQALSLHRLDAPLQRLADILHRTDGALVVHYGEATTLKALISPEPQP